MKKYLTFTYKPYKPSIVIDGNNPIFETAPFDEYLPTTGTAHEHILIKNFRKLPDDLIFCLGSQYVRGAQIEFDLKSAGFHKTYCNSAPYRMLQFNWTELNLSRIPKKLANFRYTYTSQRTGNLVTTTCLNELSKLTHTNYLPKHLWSAIDSYSQEQLKHFERYLQNGKIYYSHAEHWFKTLVKDLTPYNIKIYSPNPKTQYEAKAETQFEKACASYRLKPGETALTDEQLIFLHKYAPAYGIEIPKFQFRINTREVKHNDKSYGYTAEPEVVTNVSLYDSRQDYDKDAKRRPNLPKDMRYGLRVREVENDKLLYDAYTQLIWVIENLKDEGLVPGYRRCPECGQIYREHEGCECGACPAIELIPADNLFYGIASTYEDWDSTDDAVQALTESLF